MRMHLAQDLDIRIVCSEAKGFVSSRETAQIIHLTTLFYHDPYCMTRGERLRRAMFVRPAFKVADCRLLRERERERERLGDSWHPPSRAWVHPWVGNQSQTPADTHGRTASLFQFSEPSLHEFDQVL